MWMEKLQGDNRVSWERILPDHVICKYENVIMKTVTLYNKYMLFF
jgi:hypothetical protein